MSLSYRIKYVWYFILGIATGVRCLLFGHEWVVTDDLQWNFCYFCPDVAEKGIYHPDVIHNDVEVIK